VTSLKALAARRGDDEQGFTLIELMVVVLIIAILIAIAIPTFLGARQRAQDRAAQSDLRNGLTAEKTYYTDAQVYIDSQSAANVTTLKTIESALVWADAAATAPRSLSVTVGDSTGTVVTGAVTCLTEKSKSGTVFNIADVAAGPSAGTYYNKAGACTTVDTTLAGAWNTGW
jgi:type IV pilus assembly protein PilA